MICRYLIYCFVEIEKLRWERAKGLNLFGAFFDFCVAKAG